MSKNSSVELWNTVTSAEKLWPRLTIKDLNKCFCSNVNVKFNTSALHRLLSGESKFCRIPVPLKNLAKRASKSVFLKALTSHTLTISLTEHYPPQVSHNSIRRKRDRSRYVKGMSILFGMKHQKLYQDQYLVLRECVAWTDNISACTHLDIQVHQYWYHSKCR